MARLKQCVPAVLAVSALAGCSSPSNHYCGEAFCLTENPTKVSKTSPVEDFNLYRVELAGKQFLVYEGNRPNTQGDRPFGPIDADQLPKGFASGQLFGGDRGYQILLRTRRSDWPNYVAVSLATKDPRDLEQLIAKLEAK